MSSFWGEILVHGAFFMAFLPVFFFVFVGPTQSAGLEQEVFHLIQPVMNGIALGVTPSEAQTVAQEIQNVSDTIENAIGLPSVTQDLQKQNNMIFTRLMWVVGITVPTMLLIGSFLAYRTGENMSEFFLSNVVSILFIALTETLIVVIYMSQFHQFNPTYFIGLILQNWNQATTQCNYLLPFIKSLLPTFVSNAIFGS